MLTEAPVGSSLPGLSRRLSEGVASLEGASRDIELGRGELTAWRGGGVNRLIPQVCLGSGL